MRIFWAVIGVLVLVTVGVLFFSRPPQPVTQPAAPERAGAIPAPSVSAAQPAPPAALAHTPEPVSAPVVAEPQSPAEPEAKSPVADGPDQTQPPIGQDTVAAEHTDAVADAATKDPEPPDDWASLEPVPLPTLNELLGLPDLVTSSRRPQGTAEQPVSSGPASASSGGEASAGAAAKLVRQDDGTTLVDSRFTMRGNGEKATPYEVSWDMLLSAQESYQPRLGKKVIPDRLMMLDGKWVKITGYVAFPIMASTADEMLVMLNQWDGCCIGVPPTPYDAVEVRLSKAAEGDDRLMTSGVVTGRLRVDPFLVRDWLVSLYMMEDAAVIPD